MSEFKDFDAAWEEAGGDDEEIIREFKLGDEMFEAHLSPNAGDILEWMSNTNRLEAIPQLMRTFLSSEDYERLIKTLKAKNLAWQRLEPVISWLAEEMAGGSGNDSED